MEQDVVTGIKAQVGTFVVLMMPGWMKEYSYKRFLRKSE